MGTRLCAFFISSLERSAQVLSRLVAAEVLSRLVAAAPASSSRAALDKVTLSLEKAPSVPCSLFACAVKLVITFPVLDGSTGRAGRLWML